MNHTILGLFIIFLGGAELLAGYFKVRYWIFTRNEKQIARDYGEAVVFRRRIITGVVGLFIGVITILWGNF